MGPRPVVRCLIAWPQTGGEVKAPILMVELEEADRRRREGWIVVGPDPADMAALARWQREQEGS